jgi:ribose transport system substrate-binding protein
MKRFMLLVLIVVFTVPVVVLYGGKKAEEEVEIEKPQGEAVEKPSGSMIDQWIMYTRKGSEKYRGSIDPSFRGPDGQVPTWDTEVVLTENEVERLREGGYRVAVNLDGPHGGWTKANERGIRDACEHLGMELVAFTDSEYNPTKQKSDIENLLALRPDIIISAPVDKITAAEIYKPAVDAGVKLVFWSNQPQGYSHKQDFVGISTAMPYDQAKFMAEEIIKLASKNAKVGLVCFAADFWITNYQEEVLRKILGEKRPDLTIIEKGFMALPEAESEAAAIIQTNPDVEVLYASWYDPALYAATACQSAGRDDIKIVTQGVDVPALVNLLSGGNIASLVTDAPYLMGVNHVLVGAHGVLGKQAPEFTLCPAAIITKDNLKEVWNLAFRTPVPDEVAKLLK